MGDADDGVTLDALLKRIEALEEQRQTSLEICNLVTVLMTDEDDISALHLACRKGLTGGVAKLLSLGADAALKNDVRALDDGANTTPSTYVYIDEMLLRDPTPTYTHEDMIFRMFNMR